MKRLVIPIVIGTMMFVSICCHAVPAWDTQAVNADGTGSYSLVNADPEAQNKVTVEGVALAGYDELLDPSVQYTAFIQDTSAVKGGIQAWSGSFYYGSGWRPSEYCSFQAGDRLRITGYLANNRGKVVINDRHSSAAQMRFTVEVIDHPGMPDAELIPSLADCTSFDVTRATGGERYQGRWVIMNGMEPDTSAGSIAWGAGKTIPMKDGTGYINMLLSGVKDFGSSTPAYAKFAVAAIFDQEDLAAPFTDSYRLWVKSPSHIAESLDTCAEASRSSNHPVCVVNKRVARLTPAGFVLADSSGELEVLSDNKPSVGSYIGVMGTVSGAKLTADVLQQAGPSASVTVTPTVEGWLHTLSSFSYHVNIKSASGLDDSFDTISASDGTFSLGILPQVPMTVQISARPLLDRIINIAPTSSTLSVPVSLVSGDADGDGQVNLFDMVELDKAFGTSNANADLNGDGQVNLFDYVVIDQAFGAQADHE